jgi:hypothetical protein
MNKCDSDLVKHKTSVLTKKTIGLSDLLKQNVYQMFYYLKTSDVTPRIYINKLFLTLQQQGRLPNSLLCINKEAGRVQSNKIFRGRMFTGKPQHL